MGQMTSSRILDVYFPSWILAETFDRTIDFSFPRDGRIFSDEQDCFLKTVIGERGGAKVQKPYNVKQVHGDGIVLIKKNDLKNSFDARKNSNDDLKEADGIITDCDELPIIVRTADCVPVFIFDEKFKVVSLVHAGWRSTYLGIVKKAVLLMCDKWNSELSNIRVVFGPAIRRCCYEVGFEFKERFIDSVLEKDDRYWLDLVKENIRQLKQFLPEGNNLFDCGICTCCDSRYFSYRREGGLSGRNLSIMMIRGE